jgi:hypothetical protein
MKLVRIDLSEAGREGGHGLQKKHGRCLNPRSARWSSMEAHGAAGRDFLCVLRGNLVLPDIGWGRCVVQPGVSHGRQTNE